MEYAQIMEWFKGLRVGDHVLVRTRQSYLGSQLAKGTVIRKTPGGNVRVGDILNLAHGVLFTRPTHRDVVISSWDEHAQNQVARQAVFSAIRECTYNANEWARILRDQQCPTSELEQIAEQLQALVKRIKGE